MPGLLPDADRLAHRVEQPLGLVAHVRDVDAAVPGRHLGERDDLLDRREAAGHVEEARRQAERARLHRLGHERAHAVELVARRLAVLHAQHLAAYRALAREDRPVRADAGGGNLLEVRADGPRRAAVVAFGEGRDPLQQVVVGGRHVEDAAHRVGVRVDEAGRDDQPRRIHHAIRRRHRRDRRRARCGRRAPRRRLGSTDCRSRPPPGRRARSDRTARSSARTRATRAPPASQAAPVRRRATMIKPSRRPPPASVRTMTKTTLAVRPGARNRAGRAARDAVGESLSLRTVIDITLPTTFRTVPLACGSCGRHVAR